MANRHIKIINGRKYYYSSIRVGKKVTSRYLGPVEAKKKRQEEMQETQETQEAQVDVQKEQQEEDYIG